MNDRVSAALLTRMDRVSAALLDEHCARRRFFVLEVLIVLASCKTLASKYIRGPRDVTSLSLPDTTTDTN